MLSDRDIFKAIHKGEIRISPFHPALVQPASIDLRLSDKFVFPDSNDSSVHQMPSYLLEPGEFILASTVEHIYIAPSLSARFEGRSSFGRLGLLTHITAGFIDPGFRGDVTLELSNVSQKEILLEPGIRIGQISFTRLESPAERPYGSAGLGSHYQGQRGPTISVPNQRSPKVDDL